jgi:hypothetical protein
LTELGAKNGGKSLNIAFSGIKTPFFDIISMRGAIKTGGGWGFVIGDDW